MRSKFNPKKQVITFDFTTIIYSTKANPRPRTVLIVQINRLARLRFMGLWAVIKLCSLSRKKCNTLKLDEVENNNLKRVKNCLYQFFSDYPVRTSTLNMLIFK